MKNTVHAGKSFDGFAKARKGLEQIYMVNERGDESLGAGGMLLPRPRENLMQIR